MTDDKLRAALEQVRTLVDDGRAAIFREETIDLIDRALASATDEGTRTMAELGICPVCNNRFRDDGHAFDCPLSARPAVPALDVERLAQALDADWSPAWREVPVIGPNGVEFTEVRWDKLALAEIVAREYAALQEKPE